MYYAIIFLCTIYNHLVTTAAVWGIYKQTRAEDAPYHFTVFRKNLDKQLCFYALRVTSTCNCTKPVLEFQKLFELNEFAQSIMKNKDSEQLQSMSSSLPLKSTTNYVTTSMLEHLNSTIYDSTNKQLDLIHTTRKTLKKEKHPRIRSYIRETLYIICIPCGVFLTLVIILYLIGYKKHFLRYEYMTTPITIVTFKAKNDIIQQ